MDRVDYEVALFDVLEAIVPRFPRIAGGFARCTGGFERDYVLSLLAAPTDKVVEANLADALTASLAKRSVATMDPPYAAAFNAALDMVARDTAAALALAQPAAGWKLVPVEPTEAMIQAVWRSTLGGSLLAAERAARAMLEAAPEFAEVR